MIVTIKSKLILNLSPLVNVPYNQFSGIKAKPKFRPKSSWDKINVANNETTNKNQANELKTIIRGNKVLKEVKGEILYGIYPVLMALKSGKRNFFRVYYNENTVRTKKIVELATAKGIDIQIVPPKQLTELARNSTKEDNCHQGICADVEKVVN